jgi:hypothetical protein
MEESKTPETDKCVEDNKHLKFLQESNWIAGSMVTLENPIVDLCRKLERSRDHLRAALCYGKGTTLLSKWLQAMRERNEAQEELNDIRLNLGNDAEGRTLLHSVCAVQNERDEAREQLRIAVGLLSTQPQFADKHPEDVLAFVKEGAK